MSFIGTFLIIGMVNFLLTMWLDASFFDYSVFVGFFATILIYFFTSSGGYSSRNLDLQVQGSTGIRQEETKKSSILQTFSPALFYTF